MKRLILILAVLSAVAVVNAQDFKARLEKSPRHLEWVTLKHGDREIGCYVGYPEAKTKVPAVIVIHENRGLNDWARAMVDELAEAGYVAIAPDMLWGAGAKGGGTAELTDAEIGQKFRTLNPDQITADLNAALEHVTKDVACNGKVVTMGFCWGGGQSFRFATNSDKIKAALVFYGQAPKEEELARIKCPVYGFYGGTDARITAAVPQVTEQMKKAEKTYDPVTYEGAAHAFMRLGEDPAGSEANKKAREAAWLRVKEIVGKL